MNLAIIQISDIHISNKDNSILNKARAIKAAVQPLISSESALLLACSGDVAYSGTKQEYDVAKIFMADLATNLAQIQNAHFLGTVIVPGNHDCNFSKEGDARPVLLSSVAANLEGVDLLGDSIQQLLKVQKKFFEFESAFCNREIKNPSEQVAWTFTFDFSGTRISVRCLNTSLFSKLKETGGQLYFPLKAIPVEEGDSDIVISMFHHPYGWLAPDNSREFRRRIESQSDVVLTGHEHDGDSYTRITHTGDETSYVEGAPLQADVVTGFNVILINLSENAYQVCPYHWAKELFEPGPSEARVFVRKQSLISSRFENTPEFSKYLDDVGTGFSHPDRSLTLRDLFVYPELKMASVTSKNQLSIHGSEILSFVAGRDFLHIAGAPTSGKTTLARALYVDLQHDWNMVPILLSGTDLKGSSKEDLDKIVEASYRRQYRATMYERFRQLDRERKVLFIDDWHRCRVPGKTRRKILEGLRSIFAKVIVFSDEVSLFQLLADTAADGSASESEYCEIKEFGYRLRSELIRKWHSISTDIDDLELTSRISTSENLLDTLVRKGIVPSWPVFILSVLQTSSLQVEETASYGSYGHLYEALLTRRMVGSSKRRNSLGLKYAYLALVAYELFREEKTVLNESELRRVHSTYERDYHVAVDERELWEELSTAHVFVRNGDEFKFQYKYAYYFFVAKYFQLGIGNVEDAPALRAQLSYMVRCVHDEDYANILIFYIYLTKDRVLIEEMLGVASRIYSEKEPAHLTTDVDFVNSLRFKAPDILIERSSIEENREARRSQMDSSDEKEVGVDQALAKTEYRDDISDALKIEFAFKSLHVMGQVVKNFPLDLKGDLKLALTRQSYELTLRTLRTYLNIIENNVGEILALFDTALRTLQPFSRKTNEEIRSASQSAMVRLTEFAIFGMIKRLSLAVGVVDLKETYHQVRELVGEEDVPTRLIDLSIKLDHFNHIPEADVEELERRLRDNITAYTILKLLVAEFLHLFPCDYKVEQRMVQLFKFQPNIPKLGEKRVKKLVK
ncbi:MAG TPA: metallophosphoesterase [Verrucomicrobiae bacterium]|nr:metallophosphoesterase [Verrucomicrobiae bacterium]